MKICLTYIGEISVKSGANKNDKEAADPTAASRATPKRCGNSSATRRRPRPTRTDRT